MKIGAIIQARVSSTRLPGKVLKNLPFGGAATVLEQVIRRAQRSQHIGELTVATTTGREDDEIAGIVERSRDVRCFRGSRDDVLSRYYFAARESGLDIIVRITSDCPCIDPRIVDLIIERHLQTKADYTSNTVKRTYPHGLDAEVFNFDTLEQAYKNAKDEYEREHVTAYIYRNPAVFKISQVEAASCLNAPAVRITLDTSEDYTLLCILFDYLYSQDRHFTALDIVNLFKNKPWLGRINRKNG